MSHVDALDARVVASITAADVVLDVGAGYGAFSAAALARGATVIAVEPSARRAHWLTHCLDASLTVLPVAVGSAPGRFVDRDGVHRLADTAADDVVIVETVTLASLVTHYRPTVIRFRAVGHEAELRASDLSARAVIVHLDALVSSDIGVHCVIVNGEAVRVDTWWPRSRMAVLLGAHGRDATTADVAAAVVAESWVREPRRRTRLAGALADERMLWAIDDVAATLDRLLLDPSDDVADAAAWWRRESTDLDRVRRRVRAFDALAARFVSDGERPAPLPLPR